jgi:hypothetical protein
VNRWLGLLVALDLLVGRLEAPLLADRLVDHLEYRLLAYRLVGRLAHSCLLVGPAAGTPVGHPEGAAIVPQRTIRPPAVGSVVTQAAWVFEMT